MPIFSLDVVLVVVQDVVLVVVHILSNTWIQPLFYPLEPNAAGSMDTTTQWYNLPFRFDQCSKNSKSFPEVSLPSSI